MPLAKHEDTIKTLPSDRADQPFRAAILPRRARRRWAIANAQRVRASCEDLAIGPVTIANEISRRGLPAQGLGELARQSFGVGSHFGWVCCTFGAA